MTETITWVPIRPDHTLAHETDDLLQQTLYDLRNNAQHFASELWPGAPFSALPSPNIVLWNDLPRIVVAGNGVQTAPESSAHVRFNLYGSIDENEGPLRHSHFAMINAHARMHDGDRVLFLTVMASEYFSPSMQSTLLLGVQSVDEPLHELAGIHWAGDSITSVRDPGGTLSRLELDESLLTPRFCQALIGLILGGELQRDSEYAYTNTLIHYVLNDGSH